MLGGDSLKHLRGRAMSTSIFIATQYFASTGPSIIICVLYYLGKEMKEARN